MKKFFSIVAAALVAFSFASCQKEEAKKEEASFFKLTISNITSTSADVAIVPADTTAYYGAGFYYASDLAEFGADSLAAEYTAQIAALAEKYGVEKLIENGYIFKGKLSTTVDGLAPKTGYALIAYQLKVNGDNVALGKEIASKTFTTKDVVVEKEVDLGTLQGGGFEDYREDDGSYLAYATDGATYDVTLNIYDMDFNGNYTEANLDLEYSYIWTAEMNSEKALSIAKAELKNVPGNDDIASISGWVVASNNIKYKFSFSYPTVEGAAEAPAKKVAKKAELKPAKLHVIRK